MKVIEAAIGELVEEIRLRQDALKALWALNGVAPAPAPATVARNGTDRTERTNQVAAPAPPRRGKKTSWSRAPRLDVVDAMRSLQEPFSAADVVGKVTGLSEKGASSALYRWADKGWLHKEGAGRFKRTGNFPGRLAASPAADPVEVPAAPRGGGGDAAVKANLERDIQLACKQRDDARGKGRDRIAQVFQDKVDKLQDELAAFSR